MRADIKREYTTRKNQVMKLQQRAAVTFRNRESRLQEHYSETRSDVHQLPTYHRNIEIDAPLVDVVELPRDNSFNLKQFDYNKEFENLRMVHASICRDERESMIEAMRNQREHEERERQQQEPREIPWGEWVAGGHVSEKCLGCGDLECSDCDDDCSDNASYDSDYCGVFGHYPREYDHERVTREAEEAREKEQEEREEAALRKECEEMTQEEEDYLSDDGEEFNDATEAIPDTEPKERCATSSASSGNSIICAKKKAVAAAGAAKARREKQQRKKDAAKFLPVKITMNTNRENDTDKVLYVGRAQINDPKKRNLKQVMARTEDEARKDKKRDAAKWKRLNADQKQTAARGTKLAILTIKRPWYDHMEYASDC
jgi:hypothetical protein